jgi:hypothetical protein
MKHQHRQVSYLLYNRLDVQHHCVPTSSECRQLTCTQCQQSSAMQGAVIPHLQHECQHIRVDI